jgi:hypothetical protein
MNFKSAMSKFLTSKLVLNIVSFLALFNVVGYAVMGNLNFVLYFIVFAILVRYFSKNMTIVLGVPLIIVNLMALKGTREGMENNDNKNSKNSNAVTSLDKSSNGTSNKPDSVSSQGLIMSSVANSTDVETDNTTGEQQGFEPGRRKNRAYNIDYATTIEDAYDELNNILGSDGIQKLTNDTQNLMKQQMQLAGTMKDMSKLVENIQPMVGQLQQMMGSNNDDGKNGKNGINGLMNLAKNLTNQAKPAN